MNLFSQLIHNQVLIVGLIAWSLAQIAKLPLEYIQARRWNWSLLFSAGGMPSSHSSLMSAITLAIGLYEGFGSALFGLAFAVSMVVIYDAAGIRRQAGFHAEKINLIIDELLAGHPISDKSLKEVLGHTPRQVTIGILLGIVVTLITWWVWH
jgi:uncharacterized protein